jgi:hypothetical protein
MSVVFRAARLESMTATLAHVPAKWTCRFGIERGRIRKVRASMSDPAFQEPRALLAAQPDDTFDVVFDTTVNMRRSASASMR